MNAPEEAFDKTVVYVRICGGGMLVIVAYNLIGCIFRGSEIPERRCLRLPLHVYSILQGI